MANYNYNVITKDGKSKRGSIEAESKQKAISLLKNDGNTILSVDEGTLLDKDINFHLIKRKVKSRDLGVFCRQFYSIIKAGVSIISALSMLGDQTENKKLQAAIKDVQSNVEKGETLSGAMKRNSEIFPSLMINMIQAGEQSGSLENALIRMADHFDKDSKIKGMVKKALIYPCVLLVVCLLVVIVMLAFVIPQFSAMFEDLDEGLPAFTQAVLNASNSLKSYWYLWILTIAAIVFAYKTYAKTESGFKNLSAIKLKIPVFGNLITKTACSRFSRTLSTLLSAGMPMVEALIITSKTMDNPLFKEAVESCVVQIERGTPLSIPLKNSGVFPPMIIHMVGIGEETGNLEEMLDNVARYYDEEVELATQQVTALMEPLIIVFMAVVVCCLIGAVYSPIMQLYTTLG